MKKTNTGIFWALVALLLVTILTTFASASAAAEEAGGNLSLDQAIGTALKEHPSVKQFRENMAASREGIGVAKANYFPQSNFVANYYYGNAFATSLRPKTSLAPTGAALSGSGT